MSNNNRPNKHAKGVQQRDQNGERQAVEVYEGALPHPDILQQFNNVVPGAAERILKMAEDQSAHRQKNENRVIVSGVVNSFFGVFAAFIITMSAIGGGLYVVYSVPTVAGAVSGGFISATGIGAVVSAFIYGTRSSREEREKKAK